MLLPGLLAELSISPGQRDSLKQAGGLLLLLQFQRYEQTLNEMYRRAIYSLASSASKGWRMMNDASRQQALSCCKEDSLTMTTASRCVYALLVKY